MTIVLLKCVTIAANTVLNVLLMKAAGVSHAVHAVTALLYVSKTTDVKTVL